MKKTLVGLANNISANKEKIKLWHDSFRSHSDGDVVLIAANMNEDDKLVCQEIGLSFKPVVVEDTWYINHKRLEHIKNWLVESDTDLVLSTDVFDVAFQSDPFKKLDTENFDFFVGGEGIDVNQEPWNSNNIGSLFPNEIKKCVGKEIICSGIMAGKRKSLIPIYERMFKLCEESPNTQNIKDQAALIVMIVNHEIPRMKIFNLDDGWVVHCAVAGPTKFFESWGFKNNLKYGIPQMKDGQVYTASGDLFDMVHQFNRIPEWDSKIRERNL